MLNITRRDIEEAHTYARDVMRTGRDPQSGEKKFSDNRVVRSLEVLAGAGAVGVLTGRCGPLQVAGNPVPLDLAAGLGIHALAFAASYFGVTMDLGHFHNLADGALAGFMTKFGVGYGTEMRKKAGKPALNLADIAGEERSAGRATPAQLQNARLRTETARNKGPMTESELVVMAQAVR